MGRIDIITGTLGKALGGALGGYTSGKKEIIEMLRQRSRPYLFSNSVAPPIVGASIAAIDMLNDSTELRDKLMENTKFFREEIAKTGLEVLARRTSDCSRNVRRRDSGGQNGRDAFEKRRLCHSVFISRRPERKGANQNASFGGAFDGRFTIRGRKICRSKSGTRNLKIICPRNTRKSNEN